jgi:ABC-type transport system involved in Fe-S cluster assembly fused permease/ATPase subunit
LIERGVASIVSILNALLFDMIPTLLDIIIQSTIIAITLDIWLGLMVFFTMIVYIIVTVVMTDWRTKYRRMCNKQENNMESKAVDCLLNFETVKFYNNEQFEVNEYSKLVSKFQNYEWMSNLSNAFLNLNQNLIIQVGYAVICFVAGYQTLHGKIDITEFIQILAYLAQMFSPLDRFGSYYRTIQKNFIDMESMLNLLKIESEIADPIIPITLNTPIQGLIEFRNVSFHYDPRKPILKNVSFKVFPRSTVALVGPSGSGKSTILKLLFRFYDVTEGSILIDGVDIRHINQSDLRKLIGIVPQETVLFNDAILYNIAYGKVKSDYDNIIKCSQMAQIHDRIQSFPDGKTLNYC